MRFQSPCSLTPLRCCAVLALLWGFSAAAVADTIYLKNGRVIHTPSAKQVGEKIEFEQFGETVSIPASVVLRIESDDNEEDPVLPAAPAPGGEQQDTDSTEEGDAVEEELPPESNPDYWRERILEIRREKDEITENMVVLRREERAFTFSKHNTTAIRLRIEAAQARDKELDQELLDLRREAKRLGVPPGWLRVSAQPTGS